jgi:hypothetical protein
VHDEHALGLLVGWALSLLPADDDATGRRSGQA